MADGPYSLSGIKAVRVSRLLSTGVPDYGNPKGSFIIVGGQQRFVYDFDAQAGKEQYDEDANGVPVVNRRRDDQVKRVHWTLTLLVSDPRFEDVMGAVQIVQDQALANDIGTVVNASTGCTTIARPRFCMELWSERLYCSDLAPDAPYRLCMMPRCTVTPKGHTKEDATAGLVFDGYGEANANFGDGPFGGYPEAPNYPNGCWFDFDTYTVPAQPVPQAYIALPPAS